MKLPASLGQKKTKAIEQMLEEIGVGKALLADAVLCNILQMCKYILWCTNIGILYINLQCCDTLYTLCLMLWASCKFVDTRLSNVLQGPKGNI